MEAVELHAFILAGKLRVGSTVRLQLGMKAKSVYYKRDDTQTQCSSAQMETQVAEVI